MPGQTSTSDTGGLGFLAEGRSSQLRPVSGRAGPQADITHGLRSLENSRPSLHDGMRQLTQKAGSNDQREA